jgi:predicted nuclease of restriction endonuclease-like (RecB) superfamily
LNLKDLKVKKIQNKKLPLASLKRPRSIEAQFAEISVMIQKARQTALRAVDSTLVDLYWKIGKYISQRVANAEWGEGTVDKLAEYLETSVPDSKGFNRRGLYRMKQFYEAYASNKKVSPLVSQVQWSNHLVILSSTKSNEEKEFYIRLCVQERYSKRALQHQIDAGLFERMVTSRTKVSPAMTQIHPSISEFIRIRVYPRLLRARFSRSSGRAF